MTSANQSSFLRDLFREQKRLLVLTWPYVIGFLFLGSATYSFVDNYCYENNGLYAWIGVLNWGISYFLLLIVMQKAGLFSNGKTHGIGTYFALTTVTGMAIGLAVVVLILPGLYLMMRWLPVYARSLTSNEWISSSLRWSWNATDPVQRPLAAAMVGPVLCYAISALALYLNDGSSWTAYVVSSITANLAVATGLAWLTILGVAAFAMLALSDPANATPEQISNRA